MKTTSITWRTITAATASLPMRRRSPRRRTAAAGHDGWRVELCLDDDGQLLEFCTRDYSGHDASDRESIREDYLVPAEHRIGVKADGAMPAALCTWKFLTDGNDATAVVKKDRALRRRGLRSCGIRQNHARSAVCRHIRRMALRRRRRISKSATFCWLVSATRRRPAKAIPTARSDSPTTGFALAVSSAAGCPRILPAEPRRIYRQPFMRGSK